MWSCSDTYPAECQRMLGAATALACEASFAGTPYEGRWLMRARPNTERTERWVSEPEFCWPFWD